jgi:hypothetical protein
MLTDATNSYTTTDQSQTASDSNELAKRVLIWPSDDFLISYRHHLDFSHGFSRTGEGEKEGEQNIE